MQLGDVVLETKVLVLRRLEDKNISLGLGLDEKCLICITDVDCTNQFVSVNSFSVNCTNLVVCYAGLLDEISDADKWFADVLQSLP